MPTEPSLEAVALLRRRLGRQHVPVDDATRPLYRQLVEGGLIIPRVQPAARYAALRLYSLSCSRSMWNVM